LAKLEQEIKQTLGIRQKFRRTVAEMILTDI
jgi:hypothetical protein